MPDEMWIRILIAYGVIAYLVLWVAVFVLSLKWTVKILFFILMYPYYSWKMLYQSNKEKMKKDNE